MDEQIKEKLRHWAKEYNVDTFIPDDPVQFPHRYTEKKDIEVSAFLTSWISYGRRELILRKANELHAAMGVSPYRWIMEEGYKYLPGNAVEPGKRDTFYRFYTYSHLRQLCERLKCIYEEHESLEDALAASPYPNPITKIQDVFSKFGTNHKWGYFPANVWRCSFAGWSGKTVLSISESGEHQCAPMN